MHRILSEVNEIKKSPDGSYEFDRRLAIGELHVNHEAEDEAGDLIVFLPRNTGKI